MRDLVRESWLIGPKLFRPEAYPTCVSSKLCEFIADECFFYFLPLKVFKDFKTTNDGKYDISYPLLWGQGVVWSLRVHLRSSCANVPLLSSLELIEKRVWLLLQLENDRCIRWFSVRGKCCSSSAPIYKAAASNVAQFHCDCLLENFLKERKKHLQYCLNKELKDVHPFILAIF